MNEKEKKVAHYATILTGKLQELFDGDFESDWHISKDEFDDEEGNNLTHFFHALATVMPCHMFNNITGNDKNHLEFNHLANQLVFQYSIKNDHNTTP